MSIKLKSTLKTTIIGLLIVFTLILAGNFYVKIKVNNKLKSINNFNYKSLNINILSGNTTLEYIDFKKNENIFEAKNLTLKGLSVWAYLFNNEIKLKSLNINDLNALLKESKPNKEKWEDIDLPKIFIDDFAINGIFFSQTDSLDNVKVSGQKFNVSFSNIVGNDSTYKNKIPFQFKQFNANIDGLFFDFDKYHSLNAQNINIQNYDFEIREVDLKNKYSKSDFQNKIPYEKDYYNINIKNIIGKNFKLKDSIYTLDLLQINQANSNIYRDKNKKDDTRQKALYSRMLREAPISFNIKKIVIKNSELTYIEKTIKGKNESEISFTNLNATASNIGNTANEVCMVKADAKLFNKGSLSLKWSFDHKKLNDEFIVKGNIINVDGADINNFIYPAMFAKIKGKINRIAFNFSGNTSIANGDMILDYDGLKVELYKENGEIKQRYLSKFINVFLGNRMNNGPIDKKDIAVERDKEKSFWNYLWLCVRTGAFKSLI